MLRGFSLIAGILVLFLPELAWAGEDEVLTEAALWQRLGAGDHIAVMRHALAPGSGDPSNFQLGDCATQRNLSDRGRDEAKNIGDKFRKHGIPAARVYSSEWCRCLETAKLLALGPVEPLPLLNSFFATRETGDAQTEALRNWIIKQDLSRPTVLVTHQVNVYKLTGIYTGTSDIIVLRPESDGTLSTVGRIMYPKF